MGLQSSVLSAVNSAKSSLGDLLVSLTLRKRVKNTHVPGQATSYANSDFTVKGAFTKYKLTEVDGEMVKAEDIKIIMFPDAASAIPEQNDVVLFGTKTFRVVINEPVFVGSEIALNIVQVRPA